MKLPACLLAVALAALAPAAGLAQGPEVQDFNFYNTDIHLVLKALSEVTGITFVEDVPVQGKVTIHIAKRTSLDEVLETILKPLGLTWRTVGKIYHIGRRAGERAAPGRPGYVEKTFMFKHAAAGEAARRLRKFLRARGIVSVNLAMNQVTVMVPPSLLPEVEDLVKSLDVEITKKLIAVRIKVVEVNKDSSKETAATLSYNDYPSGFALGSTFAEGLNSRLGWGTGGNPRSDEYYWLYQNAATFKVGAWGIDQVLARMLVAFDETDIRIISEPDVVVREGTEAIIKVGQKMPVPTGYGDFQRYDDVGVNLTVKPWLDQEGNITLEVKSYLTQRTPEIGAQAGGHYVNVLSSREIETTLSLLNGDTGRLAGLIRQEESLDVKRIPVLGDLPLLGMLFSSKETDIIRKEVVILISPSIIEDVPPHGRLTPGISALVAWLIPGTPSVVLDWSDDIPVDNVGIFQYEVFRDVRPITDTGHLVPVASAVSRAASSWIDETPKRRGATYYYAVIAVDGAGNRQAVSNSPAITIPKR